jgi:hypothetical protein
MKNSEDRIRRSTRPNESIEETHGRDPASPDYIRTLPSVLIEPHPLVRELRQALQAKEACLADRDREIARLHVAIAFGIKELPLKHERTDRI